jgi:sugar O-acyltransferase (sialic acid O-acetyltransferase NeuD family)
MIDMHKIIVVGGGGHGKVVISLLKKLAHFTVSGYVDLVDHGDLLGIPYLGDDSALGDFFKLGMVHAALGLGQLQEAGHREKLAAKMVEIGYKFPLLVSPHAIVNEACRLGDGTVVMDGAVVQTGTMVGNFSIINTCATVDHDCRIGDNVHIAPGATLCGCVQIDSCCLVGSGATIVQGIHVAAQCHIGAGAVVTKNIYKQGTYAGVPARPIGDKAP